MNQTPEQKTVTASQGTSTLAPPVIDPAKQRRSRIKLLAILGAFAIPLMVAALWLQYVRINGSGLGISARGELIHPAHPLQEFAVTSIDEQVFGYEQLRGIWTLFYAPPGACESTCKQHLYHMRQVRLALNHRMDRVQRVLLLKDAGQLDAALLKEHPGLQVIIDSEAAESLLQSQIDQALANATRPLAPLDAIYVIDPMANVMMRFAPDLSPKSMLKDLKHLLKVSRIG